MCVYTLNVYEKGTLRFFNFTWLTNVDGMKDLWCLVQFRTVVYVCMCVCVCVCVCMHAGVCTCVCVLLYDSIYMH